MQYIIFDAEYELPPLPEFNYTGFRSTIFSEKKSRKIARKVESVKTKKCNAADIEEIMALFARKTGIRYFAICGLESIGSLVNQQNFIIMYEREKPLFDPQGPFYGNDSFGRATSENFFLRQFAGKNKVDTVICYDADKFVGAAAIGIANLQKKGTLILAYSITDAMIPDCIAWLADQFAQCVFTGKFVIFTDFTPPEDPTIFCDCAKYYLECGPTALFKSNPAEKEIIKIAKKLQNI